VLLCGDAGPTRKAQQAHLLVLSEASGRVRCLPGTAMSFSRASPPWSSFASLACSRNRVLALLHYCLGVVSTSALRIPASGSILLLGPFAFHSYSSPRNQSLVSSQTVPHSPLLPAYQSFVTGNHTTILPFMQGLKRLQEAIERHRENKDINIKYKTPLTSKSHSVLASPSSSALLFIIPSTFSSFHTGWSRH